MGTDSEYGEISASGWLPKRVTRNARREKASSDSVIRMARIHAFIRAIRVIRG